ncbi:MBL fold metallo-hydrolase [Lagierella sp.]|uniref:MBL fold metallo-hydrolase n=1 Tax=Lagierella sp. TaxID=2849657 RepID=UPI00262BEB50|nr:MBL fold metallo-hydrolase [Lagierella sp.]
MEIIKLETRRLIENIYVLLKGKNCIIIDPGYELEALTDLIVNRDLKVEKILLTHGHGDHIAACEGLREKFNIPIYAHEKEKELLLDPDLNLSSSMYGNISLKADFYVNEDTVLDFQGEEINFIYTPGHTIGSQCIKIGNYLFTGDTLFRNSVGRSDLPTSDSEALKKSLEKLKSLDDSIVVYPGHNSESTIGSEKKYNPFMI